jgi:hypothetical protein
MQQTPKVIAAKPQLLMECGDFSLIGKFSILKSKGTVPKLKF